MQRKRYSEKQIIYVLEKERAGAKVMDLCRKYGMSDATFYNWKSKYTKRMGSLHSTHNDDFTEHH